MTDDRIWFDDSEPDALKALFEQRTATVTNEIRTAAEVQTHWVTVAWFI